MRDLISKKTRNEFREWLVGFTLREIETEFDSADFRPDLSCTPGVGGQRRSLVEQYYHAIDFTKWNDVRRLLKVYESIIYGAEQKLNDPTYPNRDIGRRNLNSLKKCLERDGFEYHDGMITRQVGAIHLVDAHEHATNFDAPELQRQLERIRQSIDDDPSLAIGTAKEMVETTCKTILGARSITFKADADVHELVKLVRSELGLLPEDIANAARGADTIKRLLSNLASIAQSLGELRNLYGTGHGRAGKTKGLSARHARLAVGAASTLAVFLLETHSERSNVEGGGTRA